MQISAILALLTTGLLACGANVVVDPAGTAGAGSSASSSSTGNATPFTCGSISCVGGAFCEVHPPGVLPPDGGQVSGGYTCPTIPAACASSPTCACIGAALSTSDPCSTSSGATCTEDASGNVTITCLDV